MTNNYIQEFSVPLFPSCLPRQCPSGERYDEEAYSCVKGIRISACSVIICLPLTSVTLYTDKINIFLNCGKFTTVDLMSKLNNHDQINLCSIKFQIADQDSVLPVNGLMRRRVAVLKVCIFEHFFLFI